jgi:amidase
MKYHLTAALAAILLAACATPTTADLAPPADAPVDPAAIETGSFVAAGWLASSLPEIADALAGGEITSLKLTEAYIARIEAIDRAGPRLQSIRMVNPDALAQAAASDARRAAGAPLGPLDGVPIVLKDNIETLDPMPTTAGSLALKDNVTGRDSPLVAGLRAEGAVILAKTNLSEWAYFRASDAVSGWSGLGGQVRNPHMLDRTPCGSSSGSGSAVAASLAAGGVGTETDGSVICPSAVNGLVGFKPTVGIVSQEGIVPISSSQDTAGPMTKTVRGAALLMNAMDPGETDYTAALTPGALQGVRIGVLRSNEGSNPDVSGLFNAALADMQAAGAQLVDITENPLPPEFEAQSLAVLQYEFKHTLNEYLASAPEAVTSRTLTDLIAFNNAHADIELAIFGQDLLESSDALGPLTDEAYVTARDGVQLATRANGIDKLLADHGVSVLVSPSGPIAPRTDPVNTDVWPSRVGAGFMAAISGYPNLSVPMGDVHGVPLGVSFMAGEDADAALFGYGYAYEQASQRRVEPQYLSTAEERPEIGPAMVK